MPLTMLMTHIYIFIPNLSSELKNLLPINYKESLQASQTQLFPSVLMFIIEPLPSLAISPTKLVKP